MLISFQAFSWDCKAKELTSTNFADILAKHKKPINYIGNRRIYIIDDGEYLNGLLLTIKDMRKFCTIFDVEGAVKLTAHELQNNEHVADFNFFTYHKTHSSGMYQHYYHSCSLPAFNVIFKSIYSEILKHWKDNELKNNPEKSQDKKYLEQLRKKYAGTLLWTIIERKGAFAEKVKMLKDLEALEFEYKVLETEEKPYEPIFAYLKRAKHVMSFKTGDEGSQVVSAVSEWITGQDFKKAKAVGLDEDGVEVTYKLLNDYDKFATFNYDDLVPSLSLNKDNIAESINNNKIIKALQTEHKESAILQAVAK